MLPAPSQTLSSHQSNLFVHSFRYGKAAPGDRTMVCTQGVAPLAPFKPTSPKAILGSRASSQPPSL